jgi:hypothetical protein
MCPEYLIYLKLPAVPTLITCLYSGVAYGKDYGLESPLTFYIVVYVVNIFGLPFCVFTWL